MKGKINGTNGSKLGISGGARPLRVGAVYAAIGFAFFIVNSSSVLIEKPLPERGFAVWEPFVWEGSSHLMLVLILFPALWLYDRYRPERVGLPVFAAIQCGAFLLMTLTHVGGMVALRDLSYWAIARWSYDFSQDDLLLQLIYEGRKDALSYLIYLGLFWMDARLNEKPAAPTDARVELRDGGRTFYVDPIDILFVEAAGNYVEVHTRTRTYLVRDSLGGFAKKMDEAFVRIHRSRIVNLRCIASSEPTPSGDLKLRLKDGQELMASRRYKSALRL